MEYRELKLGEIIAEGDEYHSLGEWFKYEHSVGYKAIQVHIDAKSRRPIKSFSIPAEFVNEAIRMILVLADEDKGIAQEDKNYARNYLLELLK